MSIKIAKGTTKREWLKLVGALTEASLKAMTLGKDGFASAAPALFRAFESLRGNDSIERRAAKLVSETLGYAIAATIAAVPLARKPASAELEGIIRALLNRTEALCEQSDILLGANDIKHPAAFSLFAHIGGHIFHELKFCEPKEGEANVVARFQNSIIEGLARIAFNLRVARQYAKGKESLRGMRVRFESLP